MLALTWDGIQGLHTIIVQHNGMYDVYNLVFNVDVCQFLGRIKSELSEKVKEISMKKAFCKSQLIRQRNLIPWPKQLDNDYKQLNLQYYLYRKRGKFPPPVPPQNKRRPPWQLLSKCFWGPRSKLPTSRWGFCSGAFTTHLGRRHDAKEHRASGTTHIRRCLATEILSRNLQREISRVVSAAKSEHSYNPTIGGAEKLL